MSYRLSLTIPGLPETTNEVMAMRLRERMRRKRHWKSLMGYLTAGKRPPKPLKKARLTLRRYSSREPDTDGLVSSFKHIIDGLVAAGVLENDKTSNIGFPDYRWHHAPAKEGCCIVQVEELNEEDSTVAVDSKHLCPHCHKCL